MEYDFLLKHKFEFISYYYGYHLHYLKRTNGQINSDSHLSHITRGTARLLINSKEYLLKEGAVISMPDHVLFYLEIDPGFETQNIHYKIWLNNEEPLETVKTLPFIFYPEYFDCCRKILNQMREINKLAAVDRLRLEPMAHELVLKHLASNELCDNNSSPIDARIKKIYKILTSPECLQYSAAEMAKISFLSISQMNRKFKHSFKMSPHELWDKNRFDNVCLAMEKNDKSLAEIADEFGFADQTYFSKWFKKIAQTTPCEYRQRHSKTTLVNM